jgi:hypothetical protein
MAAAVVIAGRGGGSALSLDPVAAAATKSQQAGAARIRFSLAVRGPQGQTVRLHGAGAIDGTSGQLTMQMGSIPGQSLIPPGSTLKEIFLEQNGDYVVYVGLGALSSQIPGGKHWVELNVSKLGKSAGIDLAKLLSGSEMQPSDLLGMLKAEGAKIQSLGPATIGGTATTHYRVTVDMAKALQAKGLTSPLLAGMAAQMPKVPEEVWVGKDGLVRRIGLSLALPQGHMQMTMDLYDYGADVSIAAPPSSDVFDATAFAQQGLAGSLH